MGEPAPKLTQSSLSVIVDDEIVLAYLNRFAASEWSERLIEAARVGVITLRAAGSSLDSDRIEEAFQKSIQRLQESLKAQLEEHLHRKLDANNRESPFAKMDESVRAHLQKQLDEFIRQFSLDESGSAVNRLRLLLSQQIREIDEKNSRALGDIHQAVGQLQGRKLEAAATTLKGFDFEKGVYTVIRQLGQGFEDVTADVAETTGLISRSKVGDHEVTLGKNSGAPNAKIIFECKNERGYTLKNARDEIRVARENRQAKVGVMVFAKGCEPEELGDFRIIDQDIYCTVDENQAPVFLEAAYKIARAILVLEAFGSQQAVNTVALEASVRKAMDAVKRFSDLKKRVTTAQNAINDVADEVERIHKTLDAELEAMNRELQVR